MQLNLNFLLLIMVANQVKPVIIAALPSVIHTHPYHIYEVSPFCQFEEGTTKERGGRRFIRAVASLCHTIHTAHCILHTAQYTLHTINGTLHTVNYRMHTSHITLHTTTGCDKSLSYETKLGSQKGGRGIWGGEGGDITGSKLSGKLGINCSKGNSFSTGNGEPRLLDQEQTGTDCGKFQGKKEIFIFNEVLSFSFSFKFVSKNVTNSDGMSCCCKYQTMTLLTN